MNLPTAYWTGLLIDVLLCQGKLNYSMSQNHPVDVVFLTEAIMMLSIRKEELPKPYNEFFFLDLHIRRVS